MCVCVCVCQVYVPALAFMSCRMRGRLVTIPDPLGRKSLNKEKNIINDMTSYAISRWLGT